MNDLQERAWDAIKRAGGPSKVGALFGISRQAPFRWANGVPPERVLLLAGAAGLEPHDIRPDLYPPPAVNPQPTENAA